MIVRRYFQWAQGAGAGERAEAAGAMARSWLHSDLDDESFEAAGHALTALLDDPSPLVRRALAEALAGARDAPHHIVVALAHDQSQVSSVILSRSPVLGDAELIDCTALGDAYAQSAIAIRPRLSGAVAAALAEVGQCEALISLAINTDAEIPEFSMRRMIARFGDDADLREALLARADLPVSVRCDLVGATADALSRFVVSCNWLAPERAERMTREARERSAIIIASDGGPEGPAELIAHLRRAGLLSAGFALRCLLSRRGALFEAILAELSGLSAARASGMMRQARGAGFAALYARAGMPAALLPVFHAAMRATTNEPRDDGENPRLSLAAVMQVLRSCKAINGGELDKVLALLRRFEAEAAREEARLIAEEYRRPQPVGAPMILIDEDALERALFEAA